MSVDGVGLFVVINNTYAFFFVVFILKSNFVVIFSGG